MSQLLLPPDVLGEIFTLSLPERDSDRLQSNSAPLLLCQVNSIWQGVATATHRLWDTIIFPPSKHDQFSKFIDGGGIERWFDRTGRALPLSLGEEASDWPLDSLITRYAPMIPKYASRLAHLSLVMTSADHLECFCHGFPHDAFDQLRSISLCSSFKVGDGADPFPQVVTAFKRAPKLKHVFFNVAFNAEPTRFTLPWSQITNIDVTSRRRPLDLGEWHGVFKTCSSLQKGTFVFPWCCTSESPSLTHPSLKSLTLILPDQWDEALFEVPFRFRVATYDLSHLLSAVTFPNLQHLSFEFEPNSKPLIHVPQFLRALRASLETVTFGWQGNSDKYAPPEALLFLDQLCDEPGSLPALRRVVLPLEPPTVDSIMMVLRSHPRLSVTITTVSNRIEEWRRAIDNHERSNEVKDRVNILNTDDRHLLDEASYFA